ncbi:FAD:protein FMN transferase [Sphingomonas profundi]|uniref:FAD:protein FMN transferase n=1 Tax=Alterirhizorhabdus profundi TaxID=2681549 RepID=UPI0012E82B47|nr:FAD:protein FMN transferase [Sphingomonas profundi]
MGTTWSARFVAPPGLDTAPVRAALVAELDGVIAAMSPWEPMSEISRFNRAPAGSWHTLSPPFFHVLQAGLALAEATGGAFDPAAGALVDLWGFGPAPARLAPPTPAQIEAARAAGGWRGIAIDPPARRARQPGGARLDLSGIAKGHAVDRLATRLAAIGHPHALVEIGGELRGGGVKPDGQPWWVAVEAPPGVAVPPIRVALHGLSIATSGDYRRWFDHDGRRHAHSIDPRTGRTVANGIASVTILHANCMTADALATALLVLGTDAALAYADAHDIAALIVERGDVGTTEHLSPAFAAMLG